MAGTGAQFELHFYWRGVSHWGVETIRASLPIVWPLLDDFVEPVAWRERLLHVPVPFDLIVVNESSLSHSASQQILGRPDGPGRG